MQALRKSRSAMAIAVCAAALSSLPGCVALVTGAVAGGAAGSAASVEESTQRDHGTLTYVETVLANVIYVPVKVVFAGVGALVSGAAYVASLGGPEPSRSIWNASVEGDYVLKPQMIDGTQSVSFVGSKPEMQRTRTGS